MSWDGNCQSLTQSYPALDCVAISDQSGTLYGTSKRDGFVPTAQELTALVGIMKSGGATSLTVCGTKYMVLRVLDNRVIAKAGPKSLFGALTTKLCLVGVAQDTDKERKSERGSDQMFKLQEYYIGAGH